MQKGFDLNLNVLAGTTPALEKIETAKRNDPNIQVDIFGYSRGGALANVLATRLKGTNVRFEGLIDPVSSWTNSSTGGNTFSKSPPAVDQPKVADLRPTIAIPSNVQSAWVGVRDLAIQEKELGNLFFVSDIVEARAGVTINEYNLTHSIMNTVKKGDELYQPGVDLRANAQAAGVVFN